MSERAMRSLFFQGETRASVGIGAKTEGAIPFSLGVRDLHSSRAVEKTPEERRDELIRRLRKEPVDWRTEYFRMKHR